MAAPYGGVPAAPSTTSTTSTTAVPTTAPVATGPEGFAFTGGDLYGMLIILVVMLSLAAAALVTSVRLDRNRGDKQVVTGYKGLGR